MNESKYMVFERELEWEKTHKTQLWTVKNKKSNAVLGNIYWYGAWRQYIFEPYDAIFNTGCLADIYKFMMALNGEWLGEQKSKRSKCECGQPRNQHGPVELGYLIDHPFKLAPEGLP